MKITERIYAYLFAGFLLIVFTAMYLAFTIQLYPSNYIWFMLLLLLFLFGFMRELLPSMLASIFILMSYSSYIMYQMYFEESIAEVVLNDLVWLFFYPFAGIIAGLLGRDMRQLIQQHQDYAQNYEKNVSIDEVTGFMNARNFRLELEEETSRSVRYGRPMSLLLIEIPYFKELRQEYGAAEAQEFLRKFSLQVEEVLREVDKKAYYDEGQFAAILPETPAESVGIVQARLLEKFNTIALTRLNRQVKVKVKLRFGCVGCPQDGTEADQLLERARMELNSYVG